MTPRKSTSEIYFERYAWKENTLSEPTPNADLELVIVLPSFNEDQTHLAVKSLSQCHQPTGSVILMVVVNEAENADENIQKSNDLTAAQLDALDDLPDWLEMVTWRVQLPKKKAGVGLARKIGMDQAARWFDDIGKDGIIVCFDADSACSQNFLQSIQRSFEIDNTECTVCYFEHPINLTSGIIDYELHLRYYIDALRYAEYPHAFQTLGSCISVKASRYIKAGGMNTRKAGEDFYFLHKVAAAVDIGEINDAVIYPSDRISDRVPFGTGKALNDFKQKGHLRTYSIETFEILRDHFRNWFAYFKNEDIAVTESLFKFQKEQGFEPAIEKAQKQANGNSDRFRSLFFQWWDGFRVLKYIHYERELGQPMVSPSEAVILLNERYWMENLTNKSPQALLEFIRAKDRNYNKEVKLEMPKG